MDAVVVVNGRVAVVVGVACSCLCPRGGSSDTEGHYRGGHTDGDELHGVVHDDISLGFRDKKEPRLVAMAPIRHLIDGFVTRPHGYGVVTICPLWA
jgi:hypothetical protein